MKHSASNLNSAFQMSYDKISSILRCIDLSLVELLTPKIDTISILATTFILDWIFFNLVLDNCKQTAKKCKQIFENWKKTSQTHFTNIGLEMHSFWVTFQSQGANVKGFFLLDTWPQFSTCSCNSPYVKLLNKQFYWTKKGTSAR